MIIVHLDYTHSIVFYTDIIYVYIYICVCVCVNVHLSSFITVRDFLSKIRDLLGVCQTVFSSQVGSRHCKWVNPVEIGNLFHVASGGFSYWNI